jgi:elongation factor G
MREYKGSEIRNIAVVGHGASGKTSLVDALAFVSGSSKRHGSVKDGTALTDHAAEEIERGYSITPVRRSPVADNKINLIDARIFASRRASPACRRRRRARRRLGASGVEVVPKRCFGKRTRDPVFVGP